MSDFAYTSVGRDADSDEFQEWLETLNPIEDPNPAEELLPARQETEGYDWDIPGSEPTAELLEEVVGNDADDPNAEPVIVEPPLDDFDFFALIDGRGIADVPSDSDGRLFEQLAGVPLSFDEGRSEIEPVEQSSIEIQSDVPELHHSDFDFLV